MADPTPEEEIAALVERLRLRTYMKPDPLCAKAADALTSLSAEVARLEKHLAIMHDVADQRDAIILERVATIERLKAALAAERARGEALASELQTGGDHG